MTLSRLGTSGFCHQIAVGYVSIHIPYNGGAPLSTALSLLLLKLTCTCRRVFQL